MTKSYTISGVDRRTGEDRTLTIEAEDRASAERDAHKAGVTVSSSLPPIAFDRYEARRKEESVGDEARKAALVCSRVATWVSLTVIGLPLSLVFWLASIHFKAQAEQIRLLEQIAKTRR